ncbi:serine/threonine protein kinase [Rhodococcus triatomae]|uniref:non-specific serine/threonine protein kinase n=1 Tax=Rhodococcus triatomae TaxID=300028 RepID=A0A1G8QTR6_9NOCA|nr:protein kinase [Rhodococcus triatomae]QNG20790.1 serine/threonine protein kinase [Rhodococcus triatomae]SDJ08096.1 serine/threonine protein kinase [Rhodococcus triatomae]
MALNNGALIADRYRLIRLIATGGMGQVWEADDNRLGRRVAVKVLKSEFSSDPEFLERFRMEARTTAKLNHPGIAGVYDYGETRDSAGDSTAYLVMELVNGEPLNAVLARVGRLAVPYTLDMLEQTGRALQVAHDAGVVHRDVKPGNILVTPTGQVKITDFGIAKALENSPVTRTGMVMGTAQYIAPEQALGQDATAASDVYSLGIVGYEALSGRRPFVGDGALTVAMKHVREAPAPLPDDLPPHIRELVDITIAKDPAARYADGGEFADAVSAVRAGRRPPMPGSTSGATARVLPPPPMTGQTQVLPPSQAAYTGPDTGLPLEDDPDDRRGLTSGQKAVAWAAAGLLVLATLIAGGLILLDSGGSQEPTRRPVTTSLPTLTTAPPTTTFVPEPTTQLPPPPPVTTTPPPVTTTTEPTTTTTEPTTTTTEPTTTTTTTSEESPTTTEQGLP